MFPQCKSPGPRRGPRPSAGSTISCPGPGGTTPSIAEPRPRPGRPLQRLDALALPPASAPDRGGGRRRGDRPARPSGAEKFLGETCWRTYWKGWLELRPGVWSDYRAEVRGLVDRSTTTGRSATGTRPPPPGGSGIGCVDAWAGELAEVGYLHNHARMWFASLWIFTLGLPWELGADFFLRHLLDGDPASNTLSWRWVAGLQTRGKTYLATAGEHRQVHRRPVPPGRAVRRARRARRRPPCPGRRADWHRPIRPRRARSVCC